MKAVLEIFDSSITLEQLIETTLNASVTVEDNSIDIQAITDARQITAEMVIGNIIKGDPFTYDDFTPEQIAELQRPATEAAIAANTAASNANEAAEAADAAREGIQSDLAGKTDKTAPSSAGNFASLTAEGNLSDSGIAPGGVARLDSQGGLLPAQVSPLLGRQKGYAASSVGSYYGHGSLSYFGSFSVECFLVLNRISTTGLVRFAGLNPQCFLYANSDNTATLYYLNKDGGRSQLFGIAALPQHSHIIIAYDTTSQLFRTYVNGVKTKEVTLTDIDPQITTFRTSLDLDTLAGPFHHARLFNYALSEEEVLKLWNGGRPGEYMLPERMKNLNPVVDSIPMSAEEWTDYANYNSGEGSNSITHTADKITFAFNSFINESGDTRRPIIVGKSSRLYMNKIYRLCFKLNVISGTPKYRYIGGYSSYMDVLHSTFRSGEAIPQGQTDCHVLFTITDPSSQRIHACFQNDAQTQPYQVELSDMTLEEVGCVAEYIPCGLLADKWRDTSGSGLDLAAIGTPELSYEAVPDLTVNTLAVTVTGTSTAPVYAFTQPNFAQVVNAVDTGSAPIFVKITDSRIAANKPIDLSGIYPAKWNTVLNQIEVSDPNVARGFYLNGTTPASRGCVTADTAKYVARGARFDALSGFYELNAVNDLSESDMVLVYHQTAFVPTLTSYSLCFNLSKIRTNFVPVTGGFTPWDAGAYAATNCRAMFRSAINLKVCHVGERLKVNNPIYLFLGAYELEKIIGIIDLSENTVSPVLWFGSAAKLSQIQIFGLKVSVPFPDSPLLSRESILYLINNSTATTPITVTLHPTALARLTPEDIALASSKNITITA